jgi:AAA+ ATPase superfamily predicted ATPase
MDKLCYVGGVILLVMSAIVRLISSKNELIKLQNQTIGKNSLLNEFVTGAIGIVSIIVGVIITFTKDWLESSSLGFLLEMLLAFTPVILFRLVLWIDSKR